MVRTERRTERPTNKLIESLRTCHLVDEVKVDVEKITLPVVPHA
ncbi:hypothetical protein PA07A_0301 [Cutibacterium acnes P07A]|jgi:hypothetical protein|nr:hypothetical protein [Cutibacterium acnes P07A]